MPGRKKKPASPRRATASGAKSSSARSRLRRPPRRATSVAATSTRRSAAPRKKIVPRKPVRRRKPVEQAPDMELLATETVADATRRAEERPVAIAGVQPAAEAPAAAFGEALYPGAPGLLPEAPPAADAPPPDAERAERYPQDWIVAILSAALAATVFLPWYRFQFGSRSTGLSGWETGTWGPVVFFLAIGSLVLALTRISGIRVSLPLPHPTIHEGVGWVAIFAVLLKRLIRPSVAAGTVGGTVGQTWTILAPIGVALVLAFMAGRMTSGPPLVIIPGWQRGRAGSIGVALAIVVLGGGAAFGVMNNTDLVAKQNALLAQSGGSTGGQKQIQTISGRYPKCASGFPRPPSAKPETAVEQTASSPCVWTFHVDGNPASVMTFYKDALTKAGLTYTVVQQQAQFSALSFSGKKCGTVSVTNSPTGKGSRGAVALQPCPSPRPSPRGSATPP